MESHGGNVELLGVQDGIARLELQGSCNGCAASRATLELAIKQALEEHAPDLIGLEVLGVTELEVPGAVALPMASDAPAPAFELPVVHAGPGPEPADGLPSRWVPVTQSGRPGRDSLGIVKVDGVGLLLADVDGTLLAYVNECASCGEPLGEAALSDGMLRCAACEMEFDLPRAGRAAGGEPLQLRPVPLLEAGGLRVAI